ncbi:MAG: hydantoinase/oxoprolinase family protein [Candidatus Aminicenantes bacterium]|nr:hydantoinase/oxoprolinase family protein [Candidatus Aminicenantes bacterium]
MDIRIGVDTGGTFTDFVIVAGGRVFTKKLPSTPADPSLAILEGLREFLDGGAAPTVIHGTTVATNALLERKGGRIALLTTKGFEDILSIGRQTRRLLYSLGGERRRPIVDRKHCFGLEERTTADGRIVKRPEPDAISAVLDKIGSLNLEAVAVSFIHSYANPSNERAILTELKKRGWLASISSRILPEYREYERTSTTAVNAYLMPILNRYLTSLENNLGRADLRVMQSNEGYISAAKAKAEPIRTALSGPAGGVVASLYLAKAAGLKRIISFDMGGTSTDVSLIEGRIRRSSENTIGDFPMRLPIIDIHSVGAGGGSIAAVDKGGSLRVGPQSAGADPGPACYGQGDLPTVTDANLVLGRLDPDFFLGGKMSIDPARSFRALAVLGRAIRKSPFETAQGIIDIANANMEKAIRVISIERGHDPREFGLFSFGGAGGMHAADMAGHLQMKAVIVPNNAGVLSAFGLLLADSVKDYSRSILRPVHELRPAELESLFRPLERQGLKDMADDGFGTGAVLLERSLDMRYLGQSYEINVPLTKIQKTAAALRSEFHRAHHQLYAYVHPHAQIEIVNIRLQVRGVSEKIKLHKMTAPSGQDPRRALRKRQIMFYAGKKISGSVYDRARLFPGARIRGPALIVDFGSTTFLPPGHALRVDGYLNLILHKGGR